MNEKIELNGLPGIGGTLAGLRKQRAEIGAQLETIGNLLDTMDAGILLLEQVEILKEEMTTYNELLDDFNDASERVQGAQVEPKESAEEYWEALTARLIEEAPSEGARRFLVRQRDWANKLQSKT